LPTPTPIPSKRGDFLRCGFAYASELGWRKKKGKRGGKKGGETLVCCCGSSWGTHHDGVRATFFVSSWPFALGKEGEKKKRGGGFDSPQRRCLNLFARSIHLPVRNGLRKKGKREKGGGGEVTACCSSPRLANHFRLRKGQSLKEEICRLIRNITTNQLESDQKGKEGERKGGGRLL